MKKWIFLQRKTHCYVTPFIEQIGKVFADSVKRVWFGRSFQGCLVQYIDGVMHWYGEKAKVNDIFSFVSANVIKNPKIRNSIHETFEKNVRKLLAISQSINHRDLKKISNQQLWDIYKKYLKTYEEAYIYSEPLPLAASEGVVEYLRKELAGKINNHSNNSNLNKILTTLTTPIHKSFIRKEEEDLLKIACYIQKNKHLLPHFTEDFPPKILENIKKEKIFAKIRLHWQKYCWIPYDYGVMVWDIPYFIESLRKILYEKNAEKELENKKREDKELQKNQQELIKNYKLSHQIQELFSFVQWATYMMDYKKELFTKSHYLVIPLIEELAKRASADKIKVRFMRHEEIKAMLLKNQKPDLKELERRYKKSILVWDRRGKTVFMTEHQGEAFVRKELKEEMETAGKIKLYGTCASVGKFKGKVKVIRSPMHIIKMEKGDILIAPMTSPDYVLGMKKAGAIVTDEGGLTSHAAIISRELKIPCVVGTKEATKRFKDGDLVEVNADHGSVTLLESA